MLLGEKSGPGKKQIRRERSWQARQEFVIICCMDESLPQAITPETVPPPPMSFFRDNMEKSELALLYRDIWRLAMPVMIGQAINAFIGFFQKIVLAELGDKAFNSVNVGMMLFFIIITVVAAIGVGTTSLVAQNWGIGKKQEAGEVLQQSLIYGFFLSLDITIIGLAFHQVIFQLIGTDPETAQMGEKFLFWLLLGVPFLCPGFFLGSALRGAGDTRTPMVVGVIVGILSLFLSYGLILGKMGMPRMEVMGAALAVDISFGIATLILAGLVFTNRTVLKVPLKGWRPNNDLGRKIFKIGVPSAVEMVLIHLGILIYVSIITGYGDAALAGFFAGLTMLNLAMTASFSFQIAGATLVGQAVGAKNFERAESIFRKTAMLSFVSMGAIGILITFGATPGLLSWMFGKLNPESVEYTRTYIILLVYLMPLMGISSSVGGGLRGAGDTVWPLIGAVIGVYGGRILFALCVYHVFHPPVEIIWCSMFPDLILRNIVMMVRLKSGKWKKSRV